MHSDIRGLLFVEAMEMQRRGIEILKLNTGNHEKNGGIPGWLYPGTLKNDNSKCKTGAAHVRVPGGADAELQNRICPGTGWAFSGLE